MVGMHVTDHDRARPVVVDVAGAASGNAPEPRSNTTANRRPRPNTNCMPGRAAGPSELDPATISRGFASCRPDCLEDRLRRVPRRKRAATPSQSCREARREGRSLDTAALLSVHGLLDDHPERVADSPRRVGQQRERYTVFLRKFFLICDRVAAHTHDRCPRGLKRVFEIAKRLCFHGTSRRVGFRIEVHDQRVARKLRRSTRRPF